MKGESSTGRYRRISTRMWGDSKFMSLSMDAKFLWMFLLTGPQTGIVPGVFRAGRLAMAEELEWEPERFDEAFREAFDEGLVKADWKSKLVWVKNAAKNNPPESPNVVKAWHKEFNELPECPLKDEAEAYLSDFLQTLGNGWYQAFQKGLPKPSIKPSAKPLPKPSEKPLPKGYRNQEQKQEQELTSVISTVSPLSKSQPPTFQTKSGPQKIENLEKPEKIPEAPEVKAPNTHGTRLHDSWVLPMPWGHWALGQGFAEAEIREIADTFRDYWRGLAGQKARKVDWEATWRNWVRREKETRRKRDGPPRMSAYEQSMRAAYKAIFDEGDGNSYEPGRIIDITPTDGAVGTLGEADFPDDAGQLRQPVCLDVAKRR